MKQIFLLLTVSLALQLSCEKSELIFPVDRDYPSVYPKLSSQALANARNVFFQNNEYIHSSLNRFGFCDIEEVRSVEYPPFSEPITQAEAIDIVKNFVSKNKNFIGVKNINDLAFERIDSSSGYWDGATYWHLRSSNQVYNNLEVLNSSIIFNIKNKGLFYCTGNWYPEIYIPSKFNITQEQAKSLLLNMDVSHSTIAGQVYTVTITSSDLSKSTVNTVILPVEDEDKIELRVVWQINIPGPVYYIIYVDVLTGEIISTQPTIIS